MIHIAVVENEDGDFRVLRDMLALWYKDKADYSVEHFRSAEHFLVDGTGRFQLLFLDIGLGGMNGLDAAREIRLSDEGLVLVFVTNLQQYAIRGYEVDACDFILKPLKKASFFMKMIRIDRIVNERMRMDHYLTVKVSDSVIRINISQLMYVEVNGHYLNYHMTEKEYTCLGGLNRTEEELAPFDFVRCNRYSIVNLAYIVGVNGNQVQLQNGETLEISRARKKELQEKLLTWLSERRR